MKALNAIKKITAIGFGVAMIGATAMTGFAAGTTTTGSTTADLSQFPAPFAGPTGISSTIVIGGDHAKTSDVIGAINIVAGLSQAGSVGTNGEVTFETSKTVVPNAQPIYVDINDNNPEFPMKGQTVAYNPLTKDNMSSSAISFLDSNSNSDLAEQFYINYTPGEDTNDESCPTDKVVTVNQFDYTYNLSNSKIQDKLSRANKNDFRYTINLLGENYNVYFPANQSSYTNLKDYNTTGSATDIELMRNAGDIIAYSGNNIDLKDQGYPGYYLHIDPIIGTDKVTVRLMKGTNESNLSPASGATDISSGSSGIVSDDNNSSVSININVGTIGPVGSSQGTYGARISFKSGEIKIGEYLNSDLKLWKLDQLYIDNSSTPYIFVRVSFQGANTQKAKDMYKCKVDDQNLYLGNDLSMNGYYSLQFPSMTTPAKSPLTLSYNTNKDQLTFETSGDGYFKISGQKYKSVTLQMSADSSNTLNLSNTTYYSVRDTQNLYKKDTEGAPGIVKNSQKVTNGAIVYYVDSNSNNDNNQFDINFRDSDDDAKGDYIDLVNVGNMENDSITLDRDWGSYGDEGFLFGSVRAKILENTANKYFGVGESTDFGITVNKFDESTVELSVPDDAVRYEVYLGKGSASVQKGTLVYKEGDTTADIPAGSKVLSVGGGSGSILKVGIAQLASDVLSSDANLDQANYIVVGGPCVNNAASVLMKGQKGQFCENQSGIPENSALIELFNKGDHVSLVVAGWTAQDTLAASRLLGNYKSAESQSYLKGTKVVLGPTDVTKLLPQQ